MTQRNRSDLMKKEENKTEASKVSEREGDRLTDTDRERCTHRCIKELV